jgi:transposase
LDHGVRHPPPRLVTKKKTIIASERDPWARVAFALQQTEFDATELVVIDEVGSNLDMTPTHAWVPIGERTVARVPRNTPINTTTIASIRHQGMGPALIVAGGVDRVTFATYLEQVLAPTLRAGQIVIADNLSAHTSPRAQAIMAACGCRLVYLPPYSPDYSPIELAFAQIKADLRRATARTREALEEALATALQQISAADARAFFEHCGYRFPPDLHQWFCTSL